MQNTAIVAVAIIDILLGILSQVALWQRKEYRWDRVRVYLISAKGSLTKQHMFFALSLLVGIGWTVFMLGNLLVAEYFGIAALLTVLFAHIARIWKKGVVRPTFTPRVSVVLAIAIILCIAWGVFMVLPNIVLGLQIATLLFFLPVLVTCSVYGSAIPTLIQKRRVIARAKALRASLHNLTVVGITGSVGKTSTKAYLLHILEGESKSVHATAEHRNSPYPVALDMLEHLTSTTKIYIAEMGAYKKGEIQKLARIVQPNMAIITAITNQHAGLFGSLENLAFAKWELIDTLPDDGIAVLNADDEHIVTKAKTLQKKIIWFSLKEKMNLQFASTIVSQGQLYSALAAAAAARALGVLENQISEKLKTLPALARTMEEKTGINKCRVIDDSYSASEASVLNAIEYLMSLPANDKRLVLIPIIELGKEGEIVHERIGKALAQLVAHVYIYGDAYKKDIQRGLGTSPKATVFWFDDAKKMAQEITKNVTKETVLLLEGRVPKIVMHSVMPESI